MARFLRAREQSARPSPSALGFSRGLQAKELARWPRRRSTENRGLAAEKRRLQWGSLRLLWRRAVLAPAVCRALLPSSEKPGEPTAHTHTPPECHVHKAALKRQQTLLSFFLTVRLLFALPSPSLPFGKQAHPFSSLSPRRRGPLPHADGVQRLAVGHGRATVVRHSGAVHPPCGGWRWRRQQGRPTAPREGGSPFGEDRAPTAWSRPPAWGSSSPWRPGRT